MNESQPEDENGLLSESDLDNVAGGGLAMKMAGMWEDAWSFLTTGQVTSGGGVASGGTYV